MKRKTYSEQQIVKIRKEAEAGVPVAELSQSVYYKWKARYGGMDYYSFVDIWYTSSPIDVHRSMLRWMHDMATEKTHPRAAG